MGDTHEYAPGTPVGSGFPWNLPVPPKVPEISVTEVPDERALARLGEGFQTDVDIRGQFRIHADEIEDVGGSDTGPMPSELLLASLASCMCMAMLFAARKQEVSLPDLEVEAQGERDPEWFRFRSIRLIVRSPLEPGPLSNLLGRAKRYCYVSNTLDGGCELTYTCESTRLSPKDESDRDRDG